MDRDEKRAYMRDYQRARYARLKKEGRCTICGEPMNGDEHYACRKCREWCSREAARRRRERRERPLDPDALLG